MSLAEREPLYQNIQVDIGDLKVDFLGAAGLSSATEAILCPPHFHARHELQYVLSGNLEVRMDEDTVISLREGTALLVPPNMLHRSIAGEGQRLTFTFSMYQISAGATEEGFSEYQHYCALLGNLQKPVVIQDKMMQYCFMQLASLSDIPAERHKQKSLLSLVFIRLAELAKDYSQIDGQTQALSSGRKRGNQYSIIEHFVNTRYSRKTSVEELASMLHMSRRQTDRIILQIFGKSFAALILDRRMSVSQTLLKKTDISCTEIAQRVGYSTYAGFYLAFKQYFGIAPDEVRRKNKER